MIIALSRFTIANGMAEEVRAAHEGIPNGLKLVPGNTAVTLFEIFARCKTWLGERIGDAERGKPAEIPVDAPQLAHAMLQA